MGTTTKNETSRRAATRRALAGMRSFARRSLDPLLKPAVQEAVLAVELDLDLTSAVKSAARNILVGYAGFADAFFAALDAQMNEAVAELLDDRPRADGAARADRRGLALVAYDQMEEQATVDSIAARLRNAADVEYVSLTRRVARAVRLPALGDRDNPFHPLRYCRALGVAIDRFGFRGDERKAILKAFDLPLRKPLIAVYAALNRRLEEQGVSDEEAAAYAAAPVRRRANAGDRPKTDRGEPERAPAEEPADAGTELDTAGPAALHPGAASASATTAEQLLTALYRRVHARPVAGIVPSLPAVPVLAPPGGPDAADGDTVRAAGERRPDLAPGGAQGSAGAEAQGVAARTFDAVDPALLASINEFQRLNALATVTGRRSGSVPQPAQDEQHQRQVVADRATRQVDKLTIELVGLVFDRIQQDEAIPPQIRLALSRLQFPVMKAALADADLFVSPSQPARRLMDRIASTAVGWSPEGAGNARYLAEVNRIVNTVLLAVSDGPAVFDTALDAFEKFLAEERGDDDDPVIRARQALEDAEQREGLAAAAAASVRSAIDGVPLEAYLREFLRETWVKVLVAAALRERAEPGFAARFRDAVAELLWTVEPNFDAADRKRLVKKIPVVLDTLREGLQLIDVPFLEMRPFFKRLMASHAQAAKTPDAAPGGSPDAPQDGRLPLAVAGETASADEATAPRELAALMLRDAIAANHAEINLVGDGADREADEPAADGGLSDDAIDAVIEGWQRGTWFELWTGEATERVRFHWVSPRRHFYLFTSSEGGRVHSLAPAILRAYVRSGRIRPAESAPLFQRVVDDLLRDLQGDGPARLS